MKAKDMREKPSVDLVELHKSLVSDAFKARFKNFTNRLDDTSSLKKARRDVARVKTILAERARTGEAIPKPVKSAPAPAPSKPAAAAPSKPAAKAAAAGKTTGAKASAPAKAAKPAAAKTTAKAKVKASK
jgi:large subunit ribosomal protein L29